MFAILAGQSSEWFETWSNMLILGCLLAIVAVVLRAGPRSRGKTDWVSALVSLLALVLLALVIFARLHAAGLIIIK